MPSLSRLSIGKWEEYGRRGSNRVMPQPAPKNGAVLPMTGHVHRAACERGCVGYVCKPESPCDTVPPSIWQSCRLVQYQERAGSPICSGWSHRLAWPRTEPSQGLNTGSNPVGTTTDPFGAGGAVDVPLFSLRFVNPAVLERRPTPGAREVFRCPDEGDNYLGVFLLCQSKIAMRSLPCVRAGWAHIQCGFV